MKESMPPSLERIRQLNRNLMEKFIDKAASEGEWKQRLLDDPEAAMQEADFPEAQQLREMRASVEAQEEAEVVGSPRVNNWRPMSRRMRSGVKGEL